MKLHKPFKAYCKTQTIFSRLVKIHQTLKHVVAYLENIVKYFYFLKEIFLNGKNSYISRTLNYVMFQKKSFKMQRFSVRRIKLFAEEKYINHETSLKNFRDLF